MVPYGVKHSQHSQHSQPGEWAGGWLALTWNQPVGPLPPGREPPPGYPPPANSPGGPEAEWGGFPHGTVSTKPGLKALH
jgi:hypothetical protein